MSEGDTGRVRGLKRRILAAAAVTILAGGGAAYYFFQVELPHFGPVGEGVLYRSGEPGALGLKWVRFKGIRTVVDLRRLNARELAIAESRATGNGMRYFNIPVGAAGCGFETAGKRFLEIVADERNRPVLVHCSRGKERSGLMSALYRIRFDGWSAEAAGREAVELGLEPEQIPGALDYISRFGAAERAGKQEPPALPDS